MLLFAAALTGNPSAYHRMEGDGIALSAMHVRLRDAPGIRGPTDETTAAPSAVSIVRVRGGTEMEYRKSTLRMLVWVIYSQIFVCLIPKKSTMEMEHWYKN